MKFRASSPYRFTSVALLLAILAFPILTNHAAPHKETSPHKSQKKSVAGIDVSGLDATAMKRRLSRELKTRLDARVVLTDGARRVGLSRRELGYRVDLGWMLTRARTGAPYTPLRFAMDKSTLLRALRRVAPRFTVAPRDARLGGGTRFSIVPERTGRRLNIGAAVPRVQREVQNNAGVRVLKLPARLQKPRRTRAAFKGITGRLTQFTTSFNPGNIKRTLNMRLAIKSIDGTLVRPGATFSLNKTVGERTQARGYRTSIIFENGYKTPGIGAGVSQVTGTLFNAVLMAGLPIAQYRTHSRPVAYLPLGRDATVAWGSFDFKWKNNTPAPIYISYGMKGDHAVATLYGKRVAGQKVRLKVVTHHQGPRRITSQLYRILLRPGHKAHKEKVGNSFYNWKKDAKED